MLVKSKKMIALAMTVFMTVTLMAGCGNNSDSEGTTSAETSNTSGEEASSDEAITLTIWDWDSTFTEHMTEYYTESHPNVTFNFVNVSPADYFQKLQGALSSGEGVPDIVLCEMAYRGKVFDYGIMDDLAGEPYNLKTSEMYDFAVSFGSDKDGVLMGVEQQVCPSGLAYRRDLAKEYFGTDDTIDITARYIFPTLII